MEIRNNEMLTKEENDRINHMTFTSNEKIFNATEKFCDEIENTTFEDEMPDSSIEELMAIQEKEIDTQIDNEPINENAPIMSDEELNAIANR